MYWLLLMAKYTSPTTPSGCRPIAPNTCTYSIHRTQQPMPAPPEKAWDLSATASPCPQDASCTMAYPHKSPLKPPSNDPIPTPVAVTGIALVDTAKSQQAKALAYAATQLAETASSKAPNNATITTPKPMMGAAPPVPTKSIHAAQAPKKVPKTTLSMPSKQPTLRLLSHSPARSTASTRPREPSRRLDSFWMKMDSPSSSMASP